MYIYVYKEYKSGNGLCLRITRDHPESPKTARDSPWSRDRSRAALAPNPDLRVPYDVDVLALKDVFRRAAVVHSARLEE